MTWCEHCREHYPESHYGGEDGCHLVGVEYGPEGAALAIIEAAEALSDEFRRGPLSSEEGQLAALRVVQVYDKAYRKEQPRPAPSVPNN